MSNFNEPAFPCEAKELVKQQGQYVGVSVNGPQGMTKLEYAAIKAMEGYLANDATPLSTLSDNSRVNFYVEEAKRLLERLGEENE